MTAYILHSTVKDFSRRDRAVRAHKVNSADPHSEIVVEREDLGWFVVLDGFGTAIHVGYDQPDLKIGQRVKVTIEGLPGDPH